MTLRLFPLPETFAICRLAAGAALPDWATAGVWWSVTRTLEELSVVCPAELVPEEPGLRVETGWRALKVEGPLDFDLTGILASLTAPLAAAEIPVFAVSTFDTDYLLVRQEHLDRALAALP